MNPGAKQVYRIIMNTSQPGQGGQVAIHGGVMRSYDGIGVTSALQSGGGALVSHSEWRHHI